MSTSNCPKSFEELWYGWYAKIYTYSSSFASLVPEDREEVVSDILVLAWDRRLRYDARWSWSTWFYRLARNVLIDKTRRLIRLKTKTSNAEYIDLYADTRLGTNPADAAVREAKEKGIKRALEELAGEDRELLYLLYSADLTYAEAARIIGIAVGTAKSRASRLRTKLASVLEEWI